ncbi:hypothetical protein Tco_0911777, partial [Tanacetum coccineum]
VQKNTATETDLDFINLLLESILLVGTSGNDETWDGYRWPTLKARVFKASFFVTIMWPHFHTTTEQVLRLFRLADEDGWQMTALALDSMFDVSLKRSESVDSGKKIMRDGGSAPTQQQRINTMEKILSEMKHEPSQQRGPFDGC